jgi:hypothetical protein
VIVNRLARANLQKMRLSKNARGKFRINRLSCLNSGFAEKNRFGSNLLTACANKSDLELDVN